MYQVFKKGFLVLSLLTFMGGYGSCTVEVQEEAQIDPFKPYLRNGIYDFSELKEKSDLEKAAVFDPVFGVNGATVFQFIKANDFQPSEQFLNGAIEIVKNCQKSNNQSFRILSPFQILTLLSDEIEVPNSIISHFYNDLRVSPNGLKADGFLLYFLIKRVDHESVKAMCKENDIKEYVDQGAAKISALLNKMEGDNFKRFLENVIKLYQSFSNDFAVDQFAKKLEGVKSLISFLDNPKGGVDLANVYWESLTRPYLIKVKFIQTPRNLMCLVYNKFLNSNDPIDQKIKKYLAPTFSQLLLIGYPSENPLINIPQDIDGGVKMLRKAEKDGDISAQKMTNKRQRTS